MIVSPETFCRGLWCLGHFEDLSGPCSTKAGAVAASSAQSSLLSVHVGPCQDFVSSVVMGIILRDNHGEKAVWLGNLGVPSLLYADEVLFMFSGC